MLVLRAAASDKELELLELRGRLNRQSQREAALIKEMAEVTENWEQAMANKDARIAELEQAVGDRNMRIGKLSTEASGAASQATEGRARASGLQERVSELTMELAATRLANKELKRYQEELEAEFAKKDADGAAGGDPGGEQLREELLARVKQLEALAESQLADHDALGGALRAKEEAYDRLKAEHAAAQGELAAAAEGLAGLEGLTAETETARQRFAEGQARWAAVERELREDKELLNQKCSQLRRDAADRDGMLRRLAAENETLRESVSLLEQKVRLLNKKVGDQVKENERVDQQCLELEKAAQGAGIAEREHLKRAEALQRQLQGCHEKLAHKTATSKKYKDAVRALKAQVADREADCAKFRGAAEAQRRHAEEAIQRGLELKGDLNAMQKRLEAGAQLFEDKFRAFAEEKAVEADALKEDRESAIAAADKALETNQRLQEELVAQVQRSERLEERAERDQAAVREGTAGIAERQLLLARQAEDGKATRERLARAEAAAARLGRELEEAEGRTRALQRAAEARAGDLAEAREANAGLEAQLRAARADGEKAAEAAAWLRGDGEKAAAVAEELQRRLDAAERENSALTALIRENNGEAQSKIDELKDTHVHNLEMALSTNQQLELQHQVINKELVGLTRQLESLQPVLAEKDRELQRTWAEGEAAVARLEGQAREAAREAEAKRQQIDALSAERKLLQERLDALTAQHAEGARAADALGQEVAEKAKLIAHLYGVLKKAQTVHRADKAQLAAELARRDAALADSQQRLVGLQAVLGKTAAAGPVGAAS